LGFLKAPLAFDAVRSWRHTLTDLPLDQLNRLLEQLESEATDIVRGGTPEAQLQVRRLVDTRYVGQGHELSIELPNEIVSTATLEQLKERFESRYEAQYGLRIAGVDLEFLTWTVSVAANASVGGIDAALVSSTTAAPVSASIPASAVTSTPTRSVFDPSVGDWMAYEVYDRAALTDTSSINGPALIVEEQTTTLVPAGWSLCQHATGHLVIETRGQHDTP
jgi:N-methylhydantoinase A